MRATIVTYGVRIELRSDSRRLLRGMLNRLPPGWKRARVRSVDRVFTITGSGSAGGDNAALDRFEPEVKVFVAEMAPSRVFVHAGAVGWRGRALIVPGATLSGKSSLVAALVKAGATYYSDEYAVLDGRGRVHPYPRALALRNRRTGVQTKRSIATLGGRPGRRPLTVGGVIISEFRPGARWHPRRLTSGQALLALLANTVSARRNLSRALAALRRVVAKAVILQGLRGDANETVRAVFSELRKTRRARS